MIIDTKKSVIKVKFRFMLFGILSLVFVGILIFTSYIKGAPLIVSLIVAIILTYAYIFIKDFNYIYFNDEGTKYILRYFTFIPTILSQKSIEIPKSALVKYSVEKTMLGLREVLILFEHTKRGVAKYPEVSITLLSKEQKEQLLKALLLP